MASPYIPPPTHGSLPPMPPRKRAPVGLIALIALVLLCGAAGVILVMMNFGEKPETDTAEASEKPTRIAAVPVDDGAARTNEPAFEPLVLDGPDEVLVKIETTPPGAEVFRAGESVGTTPIETQFERGDTETWQIFLDGYEVEELSVSLDADFQSDIVLQELAPEPVARPKTPSDGGTTRTSSNGGSGKKKPRDDKKPPKKDTGGRTVITGTTGAVVPD